MLRILWVLVFCCAKFYQNLSEEFRDIFESLQKEYKKMRELKTGLNAEKLAKLFPNSSPNFTVVWSISVFYLCWHIYNLLSDGPWIITLVSWAVYLWTISLFYWLFENWFVCGSFDLSWTAQKLVACCFIILFMVNCCGGFFYWTSHRVVLLSQAFQDSRFHKQLLSRFCVPRANISLIMESGFPHIRRHSPGDKTDIKKRKLA